MPIRIDNNEIKRVALEIKSRVEKAVIMRMQLIGERFVANARISGNYMDHTGNLRSSIGYVILKNGLQLIGSDWVQVRQGKDGVKAGQDLLGEMAKKYPTGLVLICVAGMEYAAAVESKGYDVITSSAFIAKEEFTRAIENLKEKLLS